MAEHGPVSNPVQLLQSTCQQVQAQAQTGSGGYSSMSEGYSRGPQEPFDSRGGVVPIPEEPFPRTSSSMSHLPFGSGQLFTGMLLPLLHRHFQQSLLTVSPNSHFQQTHSKVNPCGCRHTVRLQHQLSAGHCCLAGDVAPPTCIWCMLSCTICWSKHAASLPEAFAIRRLAVQYARGYNRSQGTEISLGRMDAVRLMRLCKA